MSFMPLICVGLCEIIERENDRAFDVSACVPKRNRDRCAAIDKIDPNACNSCENESLGCGFAGCSAAKGPSASKSTGEG